MRIPRGRTLSAALLAAVLGFGPASPVLAAAGEDPSAPGSEPPTSVEAVPAAGDGVLTIGTVLPGSGDHAARSRTQRAAVERAVYDLARAGGIPELPITVLHRDAGADAATARAAALELIEAGADALLVNADLAGTLELLALAEARGVVLLSTELDDPVLLRQRSGGFLLSTRSSQEHLGSALAQLLFGADAEAAAPSAERSADPAVTAEAAAPSEPGAASHDEEAAAVGADESSAITRTIVLLGQADLAGLLIESTVQDAAPDGTAIQPLHLALGDGPEQHRELVTATVAAGADTVLLAPAAAEQAEALLPLLLEAGIAPEQLILARAAVRDYSAAELPAALTGAQAVQTGQSADEALLRLLAQSDPAVRSGDFGAESYDAVVLLALAASLADDDTGSALAAMLAEGAPAGNAAARCDYIAACLEAVGKGYRPYYTGVLGTLAFAVGGEVQSVGLTRYAFDEASALIEADRLRVAPVSGPGAAGPGVAGSEASGP